jgi:pimeloyl-ACP methyl ester carboxylesterase
MLRLVAAFALVTLLAAPTPDDHGRPVILFVHGRGLGDRDTAEVRKLWFDGLASGLRSVAPESPIAERDVRLIWYADVLDPRSSDGCDYAAADSRAKRDADTDPALKNLVSVARGLLGAITSLVADSGAATELRGLSGDAAFLGDPRKRCASEQRVADAVAQANREGRPVILVAHSLGSLVAYDYLSARTDTVAIKRLVTVGSMVGQPELRRMLIGGDAADTVALPKGVASWINVRNSGDMLATAISVSRDVVTTQPADEPDPHEMVGYLRNRATAGAIVGGWCAAFVAKAPPACDKILRAAP